METTVIQLSDFHIKAAMPAPEENPVFYELVRFLKARELKNIVLVYNGDVIDSECLRDFVVSKPESDRAAAWDQVAAVAFEKAKEYFIYLTRELKIANKNIIFCIGNHDVNRFVKSEEKSTVQAKNRCMESAVMI